MNIFQKSEGLMRRKESYSVVLDTSFLIRLLSANDPLHLNALGYFKYFSKNNVTMYISTISIAEYCVRGEVTELPLKNLRVVPFNFSHATIAGKYAKILYDARESDKVEIDNRLIIPNDTKIFAQTQCCENIKYFVTSDTKSSKLINRISAKETVSFEHLDIHTPYTQSFGILDF